MSAFAFSVTYAITSSSKLGDPHHFDRFGYPAWLAVAVGVLEAAGAIAWIFPRTRTLAAIAIVPVMCGATGTHLAHGELAMAMVPGSLAIGQVVHRWIFRRGTAR